MDRWWTTLGLRFLELDPLGARHRARERVLAGLAPEWFVGPEGKVTLAEAARLIDAAEAEVERAREIEEAARRARGWMRIDAAYAAPDADDVIERGVWKGFTHAQAHAWLWNFVQYVPERGGLRYGRDRREAQQLLEEGKTPELEELAQLARDLEAEGSTPRLYRQAMERLGRDTFDETTVIRRV